jgi:hypothetical protein
MKRKIIVNPVADEPGAFVARLEGSDAIGLGNGIGAAIGNMIERFKDDFGVEVALSNEEIEY